MATSAVVAALALAPAPPAQARTVGHGTPSSCTSKAVVAAVRAGGTIRFACGPKPVTIRMAQTAKVLNTRRTVVIDGGGLVTLSGGGKRRILYMDTCDPAQKFTTSHCQDQSTPKLTIKRLTLTHGNSTGQTVDGGGGGALFDLGGRLRIERTSSGPSTRPLTR